MIALENEIQEALKKETDTNARVRLKTILVVE